MAKLDFISLANIIFKDKYKYKYVSDEEKESKERLKEVERHMSEVREKADQFELSWKAEKEVITKLQTVKKEMEALKTEADIAERRGDLERHGVEALESDRHPGTPERREEPRTAGA
jgi:hypothetical protein